MNKKTLFLAQGAIIGALYTVLTVLAGSLNLASGVIQVRFSEALTILPAFTPAAIPGLFIGCVLSNIITGCHPLDVIFGSLATLLGAIGTWCLTHSYSDKKWSFKNTKANYALAPLPPVLANTVIVPFILAFVYQYDFNGLMYMDAVFLFMLTVGAGEIISCYILGLCLYSAILPRREQIFRS